MMLKFSYNVIRRQPEIIIHMDESIYVHICVCICASIFSRWEVQWPDVWINSETYSTTMWNNSRKYVKYISLSYKFAFADSIYFYIIIIIFYTGQWTTEAFRTNMDIDIVGNSVWKST